MNEILNGISLAIDEFIYKNLKLVKHPDNLYYSEEVKCNNVYVDYFQKISKEKYEFWHSYNFRVNQDQIDNFLELLRQLPEPFKIATKSFDEYENEETIYSEEIQNDKRFDIFRQNNSLFLSLTVFV